MFDGQMLPSMFTWFMAYVDKWEGYHFSIFPLPLIADKQRHWSTAATTTMWRRVHTNVFCILFWLGWRDPEMALLKTRGCFVH